MKGTRPLDNNEIVLASACFNEASEARNRGLFLLGVSTGGRISELLSLQIGDVYQNGKALTDLLFGKSIVKESMYPASATFSISTLAGSAKSPMFMIELSDISYLLLYFE